MVSLALVDQQKRYILKKMGKKDSCTLHSTRYPGVDFIISRDSEGYSLYRGCDLEVGDTTLDFIVKVLLSE